MGETLWDASTSRPVAIGIGVAASMKRGWNYISDVRDTASGLPDGWQDNPDYRVPHKRVRFGENRSAGKMSLLTYRRQITGRRGRSRRTIRKLARAQQRKRLDGSSSSLLSQSITLTFPKKHTSASNLDGDCCRAVFVPALARLIAAANRVRDPASGAQSAQTFIQLLKTRYEMFYTPNWPDHASSSLGVTVEMSLFRLKHRTDIREVICLPEYFTGAESNPLTSWTAARTGGYWNAMPKQQTTTSITTYGAFKEYLDGIYSRYDKDNADSKDPIVSQGNKNRYLQSVYSWLDSPNFNALFTFVKSQSVYIPYGQSMQQSFVLPGCNISYRDLEIAYDYPDSPASDYDVTPYLPKGWPMLAFKVIRHRGDDTTSSTGFDADDAMCVNMRHFWRMPEYYGRSVEHLDSNRLPWPNGPAVGTQTWTQPFPYVAGI